MASTEHVVSLQRRVLLPDCTPLRFHLAGTALPRTARKDPAGSPPSITVVLPHRGCEPYLHAAVKSILDQTLRDLALIVVDDASPTDAWIDALGTLTRDPRLTVLQTSARVGPYRIVNAVLAGISTPLVAFQDADDVSAPTRLERQLALLTSSRADIVGCSFQCVDSAGRKLRPWKMGRFANLRHWLGMNFLAHHPTTLVRRHVFSALGGYDGTTRFGGDSDFMIRAAYLFRIRNCRQVLYEYRQRPESLTTSPDTGFGSPARRRYKDALLERKRAWNRIRDRGALIHALQARPNDVSFELYALKRQTTSNHASASVSALAELSDPVESALG